MANPSHAGAKARSAVFNLALSWSPQTLLVAGRWPGSVLIDRYFLKLLEILNFDANGPGTVFALRLGVAR
jgi:hypothetical protein